jgi:NADH:ubiquinone oxidoreductase subunit K
MGVLASVDVTIEWYLILGAGLFAMGMFGMLTGATHW